MSVKPGKLLRGDDLLQSHICNDRSLPKVGEKLFKPMNSWLEKRQIKAALEENKHLLEEERVEKFGSLAQAEWYNNKKMALVTRKVGKFFHTMGFEKDGNLFIYPEEALYLMEMNCLQLKYDGVPLSIQQAYSLLLCNPGCSLKEYRTYSNLSKLGYRLLRHTTTGMPTNYEHKIRLDQHVSQKRVFPESNEVTLEPISSEVGGSSGNVSGDSLETSDRRVKTEKDKAEGSEPMEDFAKSIADMGKSLVKNEKSEGSDTLGFESLRQKILDMLDHHFQGQISPEAMDAVSLSASKAIMVHVEETDREKRCTTPNLREGDDRSQCSPSQYSSARSEGKSPDERDSAKEGPDEALERILYQEADRAEKRTEHALDKELGESPSEEVEKTTEGLEKSIIQESEAVEQCPEKTIYQQSEEEAEKGMEETPEKIIEQKSEKEAEKGTEETPKRRIDQKSEEEAEKGTEETSKKVDQKSEEEAEKRTEETLKKGTEEPPEKREDRQPEEKAGKKSEETSEEKTCQVSEEVVEASPEEVQEERTDRKSGAAEKRTEEPTEERIRQQCEEVAVKGTEETFEKRKGPAQKGGAENIVEEAETSKTIDNTKDACPLEENTSCPKYVSSKEPSNKQISGHLRTTETQSKEDDQRVVSQNAEKSDRGADFDEGMELDEHPVVGGCSVKNSGSEFFQEELQSDALECQATNSKSTRLEDMQVDDDVMEIEDPNTWKNVKVEKSSDKENSDAQKRPFLNSNGWRNFKEAQLNISPGEKAQSDDDDEVGVIAVRNAKDVEFEVIDISDESCVKATEKPVAAKPTEEIEIVDLDESESSCSSSSENSDIKQEKLPESRPKFETDFKLADSKRKKRSKSRKPKLASAYERARDMRRKFIMDSFPNMKGQAVCKLEVPQRHLLPPNVCPVKPLYVVSKKGLCIERSHQPVNHPRRPFNPPRFNNYYNNNPRPYHARPPFKPPVNISPWQGRPPARGPPPAQINPAAMQAFQMITSIVLPMFGINNMGPPLMGQQQWNQSPMWQQPQRNWQNQQQWRFQQRPPNPWNNRFNNRPWHNRNSDRDQQDVLERPKRPALLTTPGFSPAGLVWDEERSSQEPRRPKRPFVLENSAKELLLDIEDEAQWKRIKRMEEESDSDSDSEVTITPINRTPKTSDLQPLLRLENCKSYNDIMASIDVIRGVDPRSLNESPQSRTLKISYDLFLPNIPFRKSSPPTPNFRICVMLVEEDVPNPGEISLLLDNIHDRVPLMFAIVNTDYISYYQYCIVDLPKQSVST